MLNFWTAAWNMGLSIVVPALRPLPSLAPLVARLAGMGFDRIVIVDDGSGAAYGEVFSACAEFARVEVLRHAANLGKGAALKTGIRHVLSVCPDAEGVVTADADGQHDPPTSRVWQPGWLNCPAT